MSRLSFPCLCLVTDRHLCATGPLEQKGEEALAGGVNMVQLREKDLAAGELLAMAQRLRHITAGRALFIVNDRLDIALACGADGVHLPEAGLPLEIARRLAGERFMIGKSVHSIEGALQAARVGADYLIVGTIFATRSKPGVTPAGVEILRSISSQVSVPLLAIGGITKANASLCLQAGASGVAAISPFFLAPDAREAAMGLAEVLHRAWVERSAAAPMGGSR